MPIKHAVFTEAEARRNWCPFARISTIGVGISGTQNRSGNGIPLGGSLCIASGCMAWRWHHTHVNNLDNPKGDLIESGDTYGSCGLAGAP